MILCIDIGNSQIYCGLYKDGKPVLRFRKVSDQAASSDEIGLFLKSAIRENGFEARDISRIAFCSVVPDLNHAITNSCRRYFSLEPFVLRAGIKTGLKIRYKNPGAVGADRIANAIGAIYRYPGRDIIVADFGTATTFDVITANKEYLGGAIIPGLRISMQALEQKTAKLPKVEIIRPQKSCGQTTEESIQSGLFFGALGSAKEIIQKLCKESFPQNASAQKPVVLATGGFSSLFQGENLFDEIIPDLVFEGIFKAQEMNI